MALRALTTPPPKIICYGSNYVTSPPPPHAPRIGQIMGGETVDRVGGVVSVGDSLVKPAPATVPGTIGEVRRRRARGFTGRSKEWFLRGKGDC